MFDTSYLIPELGSTEPVTAAEAKLFCRVTDSSQDTVVDSLIVAARQYAEQLTEIDLVPHYGYILAPGGPPEGADEFPINRFPVVSIASITYLDGDGDSQTFSSANYSLKTSHPAVIYLADGQFWPEVTTGLDTTFQITLTTGFATPAVVPAEFKLAIKMLVKYWWENRSEVITSGVEATTSSPGEIYLAIPYSAREMLLSLRHAPIPS